MERCEVCGELVERRIVLPTNTAYLVCYDCFYWWQEDIPCEELKQRFEKYYKIK